MLRSGVRYGAGLMRLVASARDAEVTAVCRSYLDLVLSDLAVATVIFSGASDKFTWLNHEDSRAHGRPERPLLFNAELKPKRDFIAARNAFDRREKGRV